MLRKPTWRNLYRNSYTYCVLANNNETELYYIVYLMEGILKTRMIRVIMYLKNE